MRRLLTLCASAVVFTGLSLAASWTGRLVDAACMDQQKSAATCDPSSSTTTFALFTSGKVYKLDDTGNTKAAEALKNRADRSTDPDNMTKTRIIAKVTGKLQGNILNVDTIDVQ